MQTNFDSQWISFEAKDGLNAVGIGAWFNVTNLGQRCSSTSACCRSSSVSSSSAHVLLVRKHGVVPPIDAHLMTGTSPEPASAPPAAEPAAAAAAPAAASADTAAADTAEETTS